LISGELVTFSPTIPEEYCQRWHDRKIEIPRVCRYDSSDDSFFIITNRQIGKWKICAKSEKMEYTQIALIDQPFGKLGFFGFTIFNNSFITSVGGSKMINRGRNSRNRIGLIFIYTK